ncbi:MAG: hypothetical protein IT370_35965 [Deltaproteobacteria bacterium]|nr:hypothetical protein [Deltaproteobacteria bacterium]
MSATITIIVIPAVDPDTFESISLRNRKRESKGWRAFELGSGRFLCTFLQKATKADLGVFGCEDGVDPEVKQPLRTRMISNGTVRRTLSVLERLVEKQPDETAQALLEHGGGKGRLARIKSALTSGKWPKSADPAEETAAFAHELLEKVRKAIEREVGVCWEYRGKVKV